MNAHWRWLRGLSLAFVAAALAAAYRVDSLPGPARLTRSVHVRRVQESVADLGIEAPDVFRCVVAAPSRRASLIHAWRIAAFLDQVEAEPRSAVTALWRRGLDERFGVSFSTSGAKEPRLLIHWPSLEEGHDGQLLAAMAECGVPANAIVRTSRGDWTIQEWLNAACTRGDALEEPEFLATPFAIYFSGHPSRFIGFRGYCDDILDRLINSDAGSTGTCSGTHRLYSIAVLLNVNQSVPIMTSESEEQGRQYLQRIGSQLEAIQHEDGAWRLDWADDRPFLAPQDTSVSWGGDVQITAHHLEWIAVNPFQTMEDTTVLRALRFLDRCIREASDRDISRDYCGYTHALRAMLLWGTTVRDGERADP
jgi:hypothetical protein